MLKFNSCKVQKYPKMYDERKDYGCIPQEALIENFTLKLNYLKVNGSIPSDVLDKINIFYKMDFILDSTRSDYKHFESSTIRFTGENVMDSGYGVESTSGTSDVSQYPVHSLAIEGCVYRGEGNANLVVALPSERKVIRFRKSSAGATERLDALELERQLRREVDFIRGVISGYLGPFVQAPEVRRFARPEIARLAEKIRPDRPENRRDKEISGEFATIYPDYSLLPKDLADHCNESATFCLEIKPKQGFICNADRQLPKCHYCITQFYKIAKGSAKKLSGYCPLDLFSGNADRMDRALEALLSSPQNNFRIFRDGILVYGDKLTEKKMLECTLAEWFGTDDPKLSLEAFKTLVRTALTRGVETEVPEHKGQVNLELLNGIEVPSRLEPGLLERAKQLLSRAGHECNAEPPEKSCLSVGSVIERILRMQRVHCCGADVVAWIYAKLGAYLDDELIHGDLIGNHQDVQPEIIADFDPMKQTGKRRLRVEVEENSKKHAESFEKRQKIDLQNITPGTLIMNFTIEDCVNILKNYLLFVTARDCSILMAFQKAKRKLPATISSQHRIDISEDQTFLVSTRVLDLDLKNLTSIEKHRCRDNDVLRAIIKILEHRSFNTS